MNAPQQRESAPIGFDAQGWPLPEVRSMMIDNFVRSWTRHWMAIIVLFLAATGLVLFGTWLVTPTWEGQATMEIHPTPMPQMSIESGSVSQAAPLTAAQLVKNLIEQTRSLSFLREVVIRSELDKHLQDRADRPPDLRTRIKKVIAKVASLQFLRGQFKVDYVSKGMDELTSTWLSITPTEGSTVIPIYVYGDTPAITKKVGDTIMDLLQERTDAALRAGVEQQVTVLNDLIEDARLKVSQNDVALQEARMRYEFFDPETYARQVQDTTQSLQSEKNTFRARAESLDAELATLTAKMSEVKELVSLMGDVETIKATEQSLSARLEKDIADLRADIAAKSLSQSPNSPAVKALEVRLQTMLKSLEDARAEENRVPQQSTNVRQQLNPQHQAIFERWLDATLQLEALRTRFAALDDAIAAMTTMLHQAVKADIELKRLQRESIADEEQLKQLTTQARQLQNLLAGPRLFTGVVSRTETQVLNERKSDYPNMLLAAILALAIGVFAALVLPIAYDYLNQTLLTSRQVSAIPGMRVVAAVPRGGSGKMFASA
ncbi:MAG: hypothetical protein KJZ69_11445 [Phycisphaerales bacterium]|nr:hypothetical protein [Phycisphaerales bacterium]